MRELTEGTFLRWIDPRPDQKPLGIVISSPAGNPEDVIYVLMADYRGNTDLEVFVARREDTGFDASNLVQQSMEIAEDSDPDLMAWLREIGPEHAERADPDCLA